jgi:hypothetical protein
MRKRLSISAAALAAAAVMLLAARPMFATGTLSSKLALQVSATGTQAAGLGTSDDPVALDYTQLFSSGTGANQASNIFHDRRTLTASSTENLDLAGVLTNKFGTVLTFTKIKAIIIHASSANTNNVLVGGAASNAFINWVGDQTDIITVRPGGTFILIAPDATGYAVTAATGDILKVANSSSGTSITYDIIILGVD